MQHTLLEVNQFLRRVLVANLPEPLWVTCEIMQISTTRGHYYIDLVEKDAVTQQVVAQAQAVLWSGAYYRLKQKIGANLKDLLQVGVQALIRVRVDFSERYGLKLVVEDLDPAYTLGQMLLQRQQTISTLQKEGLLSLNKTRPLPLLPQRLAIISSATAAGLQDFLQELTQNKYGYPFQYHLFTAAMQGQFTEKEVVLALERITEQRTAFDAVAILRGGGSKLDLSAFDSLKMCKAIAHFPLPVLTGIGHDIDESIADLVAHTALKTPTAVATFLVERCLTAEMSLRELSDAIRQGAQRHLTQQQQRLDAQKQRLQQSTVLRLDRERRMLAYIEQEMPRYVQNYLKSARQKLVFMEKSVQLLDPEQALKRGFALVLKDNRIVKSTENIALGDTLQLRISQGEIEVTVNSKVR